jgi:hypothetical protein
MVQQFREHIRHGLTRYLLGRVFCTPSITRRPRFAQVVGWSRLSERGDGQPIILTLLPIRLDCLCEACEERPAAWRPRLEDLIATPWPLYSVRAPALREFIYARLDTEHGIEAARLFVRHGVTPKMRTGIARDESRDEPYLRFYGALESVIQCQ